MVIAELGKGRVRGQRRHPVAASGDENQRFPDEQLESLVVEMRRELRPVGLELVEQVVEEESAHFRRKILRRQNFAVFG